MTRTFIFRTWPGDATERLRQMWWNGKRAGQICKILGAANPRAVREKAEREGFIRNPMLTQKLEAYQIPDLLLPMLRPDGSLVTIETVALAECRWMFATEPSCDAPLCGRPTERGSWCDGHRKRVFGRPEVAGC